MAEQIFHFTVTDEKVVERVVQEEAVHLAHMVLPSGEGFPEHVTDATVYLAVIRGQLSVRLNGRPAQEYRRGDVLKIPIGVKMQGQNQQDDTAELMIVKTFAP